MPKSRDRSSALEPIRRVSQIRQYSADPVPEDVIDQLLELARWTGSAKNSQPWRFIVVRDRDRLKKLGALRPPIGWLASAPLGIAIVLDGAEGMFGAYDEGRLTERLLLDLSDALASYVELAPHLFEGAGAPVLETEPQLQHASLAAGQSFEDRLDLLLEELVRGGIARGERLVVGDEVPEVRVLFLADRCLE